jgi:hypothetical protein
MKKTIILFSVVSMLLAGIMSGCENDGFNYQDEPRVRLKAPQKWALGTDSLEFSFVTFAPEILDYDMTMTLYIMGNAEDRDRTVQLGVDPAKTTALAKHYEMPASVTIPAGKFSSTFNITLNRTEDLQDAEVRLLVQVVDSDDFKVGVAEERRVLLKWSDVMTRPTNWDKLSEFFGTFSLVKYRFILNTTGVAEFDTDNLSWAALKNYNILVKQALAEYNDGPDGPMVDENGQLVTFP